MRKFLLLIIFSFIFAGVEIETIIPIGGWTYDGLYNRNLHKFYLISSPIYAINDSSLEMREVIELDGIWDGVVSENNKLYFLSEKNRDIYLNIYDSNNDTLLKIIFIHRNGPTKFFYAENKIYFNINRNLKIFSCETDTFIKTIPLDLQPKYYIPFVHKIYLDSSVGYTSFVLSITNDSLIGRLKLGRFKIIKNCRIDFIPRDFLITAPLIYVEPTDTNYWSYLGLIDYRTDSLVAIFTNTFGKDACYSERENKIYSIGMDGDTIANWFFVEVYDYPSGQLIKTIDSIFYPNAHLIWILYNPLSHRLFLFHYPLSISESSEVAIIDCFTNSLEEIIPLHTRMSGGLLLRNNRIFISGSDKIIILRDEIRNSAVVNKEKRDKFILANQKFLFKEGAKLFNIYGSLIKEKGLRKGIYFRKREKGLEKIIILK